MKYKILHYVCVIVALCIMTFSLVMFSEPEFNPSNPWYHIICLILAVISISIILLSDHIKDKITKSEPAKEQKPLIAKREPRCVGSGIYVHEQFRFREHLLVPGDTFFDADYGDMVWTGKEWISERKITNN